MDLQSDVSITGAATVGGTLGVTGASTIGGNLNVNSGNFLLMHQLEIQL